MTTIDHRTQRPVSAAGCTETGLWKAASDRWCIVVADDHGPEWAPTCSSGERQSPAQYSRLGESSTLLHRALCRALRLAPASQVLLTALEEYREHWEPSAWCLKPEHRFICDHRAASLLTGAAALLSISSKDPSAVVTILPARCYVAHEWVLSAALDLAIARLPHIAEGVLTLGMIDAIESLDEDYLVATRAQSDRSLTALGFARRPAYGVATHLREQGALIASGIMIGYAGAFAAHISKHWPGLTLQLLNLLNAAAGANVECEIPANLPRGVPKPVICSLRWQPPCFTQRVFRVRGCGWSGLKSAQAVARVSGYLATARFAEFSMATGEGA